MKKKILSLIGLNGGIVLANALIFAVTGAGEMIGPGKLGPDGTGEIMALTVAITGLALSVVAFAYGNYKILKSIEDAPENKYGFVLGEIDTAEECLVALKQNHKFMFSEDTNTAMDQVQRFGRKQKTMQQLLYQKFQSDTEDMIGVKNVVEDAEGLLYENIKHILSRISIFDEDEYRSLMQTAQRGGGTDSFYARKAMFDEHIAYVKKQLEKNEAILLEYDRLLTEISRMGDEDAEQNQQMAHIKDVVKGMKQLNEDVDQELDALGQKYTQQ